MSLGYSNTEMNALAMRWASGGLPEDEQKQLWEQMSIRERKQFKKRLDRVDNKKLHAADSFVTKRDMVGFMAVMIERKMVPLAKNLDDVTLEVARLSKALEYLALPWYTRWWRNLTTWLDRRGVRLVQLNEEVTDGEVEVQPDAGALGGEDRAFDADDPEAGDEAEPVGLPRSELQPVGGERLESGIVHRDRRSAG